MDRRRALALLALAGVAACSSPDARSPSTTAEPRRPRRIDYGAHPSQFGELTTPSGRSRGVVVVIHGGFWLSQYDLTLGRPLATSLAKEGWTAYNLEYRRLDDGGGWPQTFDDVATGIDALATMPELDTTRVITLGHSAGGHRAVWAAGRNAVTDGPGAEPAVPVTAAVSQAGVLDLTTAVRDGLGGGAARQLLGGDSDQLDDRLRLADPTRQAPLPVPVRCVHGRADSVVPLSQSIDYVDRARAAGGDAELIELEGDHFALIDTTSQAWAQTLDVLDALA